MHAVQGLIVSRTVRKGRCKHVEVIVYVAEWLKGIDYVNSTHKELHSRIVAPAHTHLLLARLAKAKAKYRIYYLHDDDL